MKTDDLITLLAADTAPVSRHAASVRLGMALAAGWLVSLALLQMLYGVRADLAQVALTPAFALKMGVPLAVAACGLPVILRLAQPGARRSAAVAGLWLPVLLLWAWAVAELAQAPQGARAALVLGSTWRTCVFNVMLIALPVGVALFGVLRHMAPTRPMRTGAVSGWLAGALGATVYALHCPEMAAPFLGVWYVLGMGACAAIGAGLGRWALRW